MSNQPTERGTMSAVAGTVQAVNPPTTPPPDLPDLDELKEAAVARRDHFAQIAKDAQAEVDKAEAILAALGGRRKSKVKQPGRPTPATYKQVLTLLGEHSYAGMSTLTARSGFSESHVYRIMRLAVERGHAQAEMRGRKMRWTLTNDGQEFVTAP
jgi:hypothetical protein